MEENIYANLSMREIKRLNVLSYGRLYDRQIKAEEDFVIPVNEPEKATDNIDPDTPTKKAPFWSKYIVVEHRMMKWQATKNQCINCYKQISVPVVCQRCYRAKYCSEQCQKDFHEYHFDDCIHPDYK